MSRFVPEHSAYARFGVDATAFSPKFIRLKDTKEQRAGRRGAVVSLAVAFGVLVAATALFVVLYVQQQNDISQLAERIDTPERSITDRTARLGTVKSTVEELRAEQSRLTTTNTEMRACATANKDSIAAVQRADKAAFDAAITKFFINCRR
ncbi:hypothetical protein [Kibdelosporangium aridum]|uniref:hypothetical protein n=1 Tax=Kibdelosporangium aridum TaxID=2030 RepID=UPI0005243E90